MQDWYVLRSGGEEDGPGSSDGGREADRYLQGGVYLRGEYITESSSRFFCCSCSLHLREIHVLFP